VDDVETSPLGVRMGAVVIDCADPDLLATFWSQLLGVEKYRPIGDPVQYAGIAPSDWGAPYMSFQRVPEPKVQKNRSHLDLHVNDVDVITALIERLGGSRDRDFDEYGYRWRVMRDPEGNEFCLVHLRPRDGERGARLAPSGRLPHAGD
jgi:predicted enzyme related to lactoylglutathione lyase